MPNIRELRVRQDLSQSALAALAGVSKQTIFRAEAGRPIHRVVAQAICQALQVSLDQVEGINLFSAVQAHNRKRM